MANHRLQTNHRLHTSGDVCRLAAALPAHPCPFLFDADMFVRRAFAAERRVGLGATPGSTTSCSPAAGRHLPVVTASALNP